MELALPHEHTRGGLFSCRPYLNDSVFPKALLCSENPCSSTGRVYSHWDAPFSCATVAAFLVVLLSDSMVIFISSSCCSLFCSLTLFTVFTCCTWISTILLIFFYILATSGKIGIPKPPLCMGIANSFLWASLMECFPGWWRIASSTGWTSINVPCVLTRKLYLCFKLKSSAE